MPGIVAELGRETARRETLPLAKREKDRLTAGRRGSEDLLAPGTRRLQLHRAQPCFERARIRAAPAVRVLPGSGLEGVRTQAEAEDRLALPVARVVARTALAVGITRDLVTQVTLGLESRLDVLDHVGGPVFVTAPHAARCESLSEGRLGLERELVGRDVLRAECDQFREIEVELRERLVREREDQIEGEIVEASRSRRMECLASDRSAMRSAESLQLCILEGLDADREAIDAGRTEARQAIPLERARIQLECHLDPGVVQRIREGCPNGLDEAADRARLEQGRSAAAEIETCESPTFEVGLARVELADERVDVASLELRGQHACGDDREIAIRTDPLAKG